MSKEWEKREKSTSVPKPSFKPAPGKLLQRKCACGGSAGMDGECAECREKRLSMQRMAENQTASRAVPPIVHDVLTSPGQPLDAETQEFMGSRFGHDFSEVRVHRNGKAEESAREVNAVAYTIGQDVVFGAGQYAPETSEGRRLMAHELAHVVQQGVGTSAPSPLPGSALEQGAEQAASALMQGNGPVQVVGTSGSGLAREVNPRSLSQSLNPGALSDVELEREIDLIQRWLLNNPSGSPERGQLLGALTVLEKNAMQRPKAKSAKKPRRRQKTKSDQTPFKPDLERGPCSRIHVFNLKLRRPFVDLTPKTPPKTPPSGGPPPSPPLIIPLPPTEKPKAPLTTDVEGQAGFGVQGSATSKQHEFGYVEITGEWTNPHPFTIQDLKLLSVYDFTLQFHLFGDDPKAVDAQVMVSLLQESFKVAKRELELSLQAGASESDIGKGMDPRKLSPQVAGEAEYKLFKRGPFSISAVINATVVWQRKPGQPTQADAQLTGELKVSIGSIPSTISPLEP